MGSVIFPTEKAYIYPDNARPPKRELFIRGVDTESAGTGVPISQLKRTPKMSLRINDTAPNFKAQTTQGTIDFHQWIGDQWAVLFSHPKDFTPVCTTELGYMAKIEPEFDKRNTKIICVHRA